MVNGEEEDPNVRYWKTKYDLLLADYGRTRELAESLETKLLEIVEEHEKREEQKDERIRELEKTVEEANRRIEQLEAACFRYKNQSKTTTVNNEETKPTEEDEIGPEIVRKARTIRTTSNESTRSSIDGITRSPEFHAGEHLICEYHKLPILAKNEGFIYGFRWNHENKIHIV
ncbi:hypothetical protein CAEBREN_10133 [Caenorhabditis brenneri]|uniref:Uncharacterized protein n=1 Tax=Caenorhabditis brenneri TaxID=135651 RepID=G0NE24_CAEBE|nr:hypothetical protein CAEBREN_10133 [Caenorhabditis brenneri]